MLIHTRMYILFNEMSIHLYLVEERELILSVHFDECVLITLSCLTLCNPMDCSLLGSSVHVILQARILEWVTISFSTSPNLGIKLGSPALRTDFFII